MNTIVPRVSWHLRASLLRFTLASTLLGMVYVANNAAEGNPLNPCGDGDQWIHHEGECYHAANGASSWFKARGKCMAIGGHLVSIASKEENEFIASMIPRTYPQTVWIGMYESETGPYIWSDGSPEKYTNFEKDQPDDKHGSERCVIMSVESGEWRDQNCEKGWSSYVCKKHDSDRELVTLPPLIKGSCPDGFISEPFSNKCFYLGGISGEDDRQTWSGARKACKSKNPKAELASVSGNADQAFMSLLMEDAPGDVWIGMNNIEAWETLIYTWIDSSELTYRNWAEKRPAYLDNFIRQCVVMRRDPASARDATKWSNEKCRNLGSFLCQVGREPNDKEDKLPFETQYTSSLCRDGYFHYHGRCYKFYDVAHTWEDAGKVCKENSQELAFTVDAFEVARLYYETIRAGSPRQVWIGARYDDRVGEYVWREKYEVFRTYWGAGNPNLQTNDRCVSIHDGTWDDVSCSMKLPFFCVEGGYAEYIPSTPDPTCEDQDSVPFADHCYMVSPTDTVTWSEASGRCLQRGMGLASINSHDENKFITSLVQKVRKDASNVWIGFSEGIDNTYLWADGSPGNYSYWAYGEPTIRKRRNNNGPVEKECVQLVYATGEWDDIHCGKERGYVCKSKRVYQTVATTVEPLESGKSEPEKTKEEKSSSPVISEGVIALICFCGLILCAAVVGTFFIFATETGKRWRQSVRETLTRSSGTDNFDNVLFKK